MKIAGLMPVGGGFQKFREQSFDQLTELSDVSIVLLDRMTPPTAALLADELIFSNHTEGWNDYAARLMMLSRAAARGCDWVLYVDEDDELSRGITRESIRNMIASCEMDGIVAIRFHVLEMWNETHFRADGVFSNKSRIVLQKNPLLIPSVTWKNHWNPHAMPIQEGKEFQSGWVLYHWGMSTPELRQARVEKHEKADPERKWQSDYRYMLNSEGIILQKKDPADGQRSSNRQETPEEMSC